MVFFKHRSFVNIRIFYLVLIQNILDVVTVCMLASPELPSTIPLFHMCFILFYRA